MKIICEVVSKTSGRRIEGRFTPMELLKMDNEKIVEKLDDNECTCNTEGGYSYCGCGEEFEEHILYVDGEKFKW